MLQRNLKFWILALAAVALLTAPLSAQILTIPAGNDNFNTPNDGSSTAYLTGAQLDQLCGTTGNVGATVAVRGQDLGAGANTDTQVTRLNSATFYAYGDTATVGIAVGAMTLVSVGTVPTNCGSLSLTFTANSTFGAATATMDITLTSASGGTFRADIVVPMTITASNGGTTGYTYILASKNQDPWSVQPAASSTSSGNFHPAVQPGGGARTMLCRGKMLPAWHCYNNAKKTKRPCKVNEVPIERVNLDADIQPCDDDIQPGIIGN